MQSCPVCGFSKMTAYSEVRFYSISEEEVLRVRENQCESNTCRQRFEYRQRLKVEITEERITPISW